MIKFLNAKMTDESTSIIKYFSAQNEIKLEVLVKDSCRICMVRDGKMTNLFDKDTDTVDKILFCTGIQFTNEDGVPQHICNNCMNDLTVAHRFKTSCILANSSLQKLTQNRNIKTEANGDDVSYEYEALDTDGHDNFVLKEEINVNCADEDQLGEVELKENNTVEAKETIKVTKKRGPYKKNGKLKQNKKGEQPKVKKKATTPRPYNKKPRAESNANYRLQRLRCGPCDLSFESRAAADAHREAEHKDEACWVCEICGQKFAHRGSLSTHARSHQPPAFPCALCPYRSAHKYDLVKHTRIHKGERPYQCEMCPATFYDTSNLNSHIRRNHQKLTNFRCETCGRGFFDRSKLNRHMDSHNNIKRHECSHCHTAFTRLSYLKTHVRKRHGVEMPPLRPGPQRKNFIVDMPQVEYVKPTLIAVKEDTSAS